MRNKGAILTLTVIISLLCLYYLSFTYVSRKVQKEAVTYATQADGTIDYTQKQNYLDSIWKTPVYHFLGVPFTYQEVKETELNLGLDLQGGMHLTLEVMPGDILENLSAHSKDVRFRNALSTAEKEAKNSDQKFTTLFYTAFKKEAPESQLNEIFANSQNKDKIDFKSSDQEVLKMLDKEIEQSVDRSFNILRNRMDRFGTSQPNIQRLPGTGRIQVEVPGADNPARIRNLMQNAAHLSFYRVAEMQEYAPSLQAINSLLIREKKANVDHDINTNDSQDSIQDNDLANQLSQGQKDLTANNGNTSEELSPLLSLLQSQGGLIYNLKDTVQINSILEKPEVKALLPSNLKFLWAIKPIQKLPNGVELTELYAVQKERNGMAALDGEVITDAHQDFDEKGRPAVSMKMNANGSKKWQKLTAENLGRRIAIVLDNNVYSAPVVQSEIPGGVSSISGNFSIEEAKDLGNILKAGALPTRLTIVEEGIIGPTLGHVAQMQGIISIVAGLAMVIIFMIAYYSKGGVIANLALIFNVFFILGILAQLNAALTLAGIAGIVLTIGMAIDANVLIFERIKEELNKGLSQKAAIAKGYNKAYSSIIDSNLTTFLTGVVLYWLGQGPLKGFAITLMIGIICSLFSAVFISRLFLEGLSKKKNISFASAISRRLFKKPNLNFFGKRKMAYSFSTLFIIIGMVSLLFQGGLNLGVDFKGGRSYVVQFPDKIEASQLKSELGDAFQDAPTEVKTFGSSNVLKITTSYLIDENSEQADEQVQQALVNGLEKQLNLHFNETGEGLNNQSFTIVSYSKVGASIADDVKASSMEAVMAGLVMIFLYILFRFRNLSFGFGAVFALFHDVLVVLSAFSLAQLFNISFEIDQVFIAAMLTIVGYSINDTVVIFDRIRELGGNSTKKTLEPAILNKAINSTISRTLITSLTTLIVVVILFLFGGEALRAFSFALLVGIVAGTYSSIFIAAPLALDTRLKREVNKTEKLKLAHSH
ncbi:protein translocase subunit SecDF [Xanthovirga aplysinae]|uniref:protein translocase subunit SecDF n=1 Tax=Xanthovirga aplysinae TaxID=2529853 RepID=UPI0012BB7355|nr:protein translocase subunit SecDF [Xanthovirga aplysinae]MTI32742.1 protein translocase subunit SecDF [Xanthovirga aplysinae]